jgi:hypothetical protein
MSFYAKTTQSGRIKALFELLYTNVHTVCLAISSTGITSEHVTTNNTAISICLPASAFDEYRFTFDDVQYIGLGTHINGFFKGLKNKTNVEFSMNKPIDVFTSMILSICVNSVETDCSMTHSATVMDAQNIAPLPNIQYTCEKVRITNPNFNSLCKALTKTSVVALSKYHGLLSFSYELPGVSKLVLQFGQTRADDRSICSYMLQSDTLCRIIKMSSFAKDGVDIYFESTIKPIRVHSECDIGTVDIFIHANDE